MFKRLIDWHLEKWMSDKYRKPLLLRGARQVGKTHAIRKLGTQFDQIIEINFELARDASPIFKKDLDPKRILKDLSAYMGQGEIKPGKTLLFFDEIQEVPEAIISLRYFFELMPSLHVIAAGSLFDFALEKVGLPVGRVSSMYMYPLSFMEFLAACGYSLIVKMILENSDKSPLPERAHLKILELLGQYLAIGGMPEAVAKWIEEKDPKGSFQAHHNLIASYRQDFEKYATKFQMKYIETLFSQLPFFIGEQFQYKNIHGEYRKRELAPCLDLLCKANVIHKINHTGANGLPLGAEINLEWFKIIFVDIALSQAILGFDLSTWFSKPGIEFVNRGTISEAFIGQELLCYSHPERKTDLFFWKRAEKSSMAEIDYVYEFNQNIIPIEVKNGDGRTLKSMHLFLDSHPKSPYGIRFSAQDYSLFGKIDSRPLYSVCSLAHEEQKKALQTLLEPKK